MVKTQVISNYIQKQLREHWKWLRKEENYLVPVRFIEEWIEQTENPGKFDKTFLHKIYLDWDKKKGVYDNYIKKDTTLRRIEEQELCPFCGIYFLSKVIDPFNKLEIEFRCECLD